MLPPVVYRLWAALRAAALREWLVSVGLIASHCPDRATDAMAYATAADIAEARSEGEPLAGLALDWSRCYDRLPLGLLRDVASAAGLPEAMVGLMLAAYANPRLASVNGVARGSKVPSHGLALGCPAATDWLALVTRRWSANVCCVFCHCHSEARTEDMQDCWCTGKLGVEISTRRPF